MTLENEPQKPADLTAENETANKPQSSGIGGPVSVPVTPISQPVPEPPAKVEPKTEVINLGTPVAPAPKLPVKETVVTHHGSEKFPGDPGYGS